MRGPLAGFAWHHMQYVLGLRALGHDVLFVEDSEVEHGWTHTRSKWTVFDDEGQRFERTLRIRCYSAVELTELLWSAGFDDVRVYGSLEGEPYDREAQRLVAVARVEDA